MVGENTTGMMSLPMFSAQTNLVLNQQKEKPQIKKERKKKIEGLGWKGWQSFDNGAVSSVELSFSSYEKRPGR